MRAKRPVGVLASGGLDSAVLIGEMLRRGRAVHPLYIRSGLVWERAELHWLRRFVARLGPRGMRAPVVLDAPVAGLWGRHWSLDGRGVPGARSAWDSVYLPGRNLILLTSAAIYCRRRGIGEIAIGTLKGNPFPDATAGFRRAFGRAAGMGLGGSMRITAPFARLSKSVVIRRARGLPLELTFSCLLPRGIQPCRRCTKCAERAAALRLA